MGKQKHILFISSWYPNRNNPTHGIFNLHFAEAAALHNQVSVLHVCSETDLKADLEFVESETDQIYTLVVYYKKIKTKIPVLSQFLKRKKFLEAYEKGFLHLKSKKGIPDLIHLNVVMPAGIGASRLSKKYEIPYVVNEGWTGYMPEDGSYKGLIQKTLTKKILAKAKFILPVSKDLQEAMMNQGLNGNYRVMPNVINTDEFLPQTKVQDQITRFLHISTLDDKQKNVKGIIRAFYNALIVEPNLELTIVGEGTEKKSLQDLAIKLACDSKIRFRGRLMEKELLNAYNNCDALLMFSNYESFGVVLGEAFSCGKPVITSRAGGLSNEITKELGIRVEKGNEEQLKEALLVFSKNKAEYDAVKIRDYVLKNYTKAIVGKKLAELYHSVLSQKNA